MARRSEDLELQRMRLRVGEEVRAARIKAGLSQAQVAERLGCSQKLISLIETGGLRLSIEMLMKVMRTLGVTVEIRTRPIRDASQD